MFSAHRLFIITILAKGFLGLTQLLTSIALYFGGLEKLPVIAQWLVQQELSEDPNDFVATQILAFASIVPTSSSTFYTIYFGLHGLLHVAVVGALLSGVRWANHAAIAVLGLFVVYQLMEWYSIGGKMLLILTAIDLFVIALTYRESRQTLPGSL